MKKKGSTQSLPEGYTEIYSVDMQKDKKTALLVNGLAIIIAVVMAVPMAFHISILEMFNMDKGMLDYFARFLTLLFGTFLYLVLHEAVHGITMKLFGATKLRFGFTGMYAFAGSERDYFKKAPYIVIALAPVVVFGIIFGILCPLVPREWFWVIYLLEIANVSGAAGDIFVSLRFLKMPKTILVRDTGVKMNVFAPLQEKQEEAPNEENVDKTE